MADDAVAVIGTGAVGRAVARRLLADGRDVVVWNRTPGRAAELLDAGARPAASVAEAVAASGLVLLTLPDPETAHDCLAHVTQRLVGRTLVALGTASPDGARRLAGRIAGLGGDLLQAGLQGAAGDIGTEGATLLVGGPRAAFDQHRTTLGSLGGLRYVGGTAEAAAVWDLALFGLWYDAQLGLLRALAAARDAGIDLDAFAGTAGAQLGHVVSGVPTTLREIRAGERPPGPADLVQHLEVVRRLVELRAGTVLGDGGLAEVAATLEVRVAEGRGGEGLTAAVG